MANENKASTTVTVACKLPNGLILRLFRRTVVLENVLGGGQREVPVFHEQRQMVRLNGWSYPQKKGPRQELAGGYGLTPGVPKDFFDAWLEQNKDADYVRNNLVFAMGSTDSARDRAKDQAEVKSGFERLDPNNLPKGVQRFDERETAAA